MFTRLKNITLALGYFLTFVSMYLRNCQNPIHCLYVLCTCFYYLVLLHPKIHELYVYYLLEERKPVLFAIYKLFFHILINPSTAQNVWCIWCIVVLWKEILFLISHAEKRLSKIDMELYNSDKGVRVAHIRRNALREDMNNRFHLNLHSTNRLYILPLTVESEKDYCAIKNYKQERYNGKIPRLNDEWEKRMWDASSDQTIFLAHKNYVQYYPLGLIGISMSMAGNLISPQSYTSNGLFVFEIVTSVMTTNSVNDTVLDILYYLTCTILVTLNAQTP